MEEVKYPPCMVEVEEGALCPSLEKDERRSLHLGERRFHFLLDSPVQELESFDLGGFESKGACWNISSPTLESIMELRKSV